MITCPRCQEQNRERARFCLACGHELAAAVPTEIRPLEAGNADGVMESLDLFSELLGYEDASKAFRLGGYNVKGRLVTKESGSPSYGPILIYSIPENYIKTCELMM